MHVHVIIRLEQIRDELWHHPSVSYSSPAKGRPKGLGTSHVNNGGKFQNGGSKKSLKTSFRVKEKLGEKKRFTESLNFETQVTQTVVLSPICNLSFRNAVSISWTVRLSPVLTLWLRIIQGRSSVTKKYHDRYPFVRPYFYTNGLSHELPMFVPDGWSVSSINSTIFCKKWLLTITFTAP